MRQTSPRETQSEKSIFSKCAMAMTISVSRRFRFSKRWLYRIYKTVDLLNKIIFYSGFFFYFSVELHDSFETPTFIFLVFEL